jgi:hypothetical protein
MVFADHEERRMVPARIHPSTLVVLEFDMPGILSAKSRDASTHFSARAQCRQRPSPEFDEWAKRQGVKSARLDVQQMAAPFARMLAKVAHSFAVATPGVDGFKPFLPDMILGRDKDHLPYLIGGDPNTPAPASGCLHQLSHETRVVDDKHLIVARIRLFAGSHTEGRGMPVYYVVVGESAQ